MHPQHLLPIIYKMLVRCLLRRTNLFSICNQLRCHFQVSLLGRVYTTELEQGIFDQIPISGLGPMSFQCPTAKRTQKGCQNKQTIVTSDSHFDFEVDIVEVRRVHERELLRVAAIAASRESHGGCHWRANLINRHRGARINQTHPVAATELQ